MRVYTSLSYYLFCQGIKGRRKPISDLGEPCSATTTEFRRNKNKPLRTHLLLHPNSPQNLQLYTYCLSFLFFLFSFVFFSSSLSFFSLFFPSCSMFLSLFLPPQCSSITSLHPCHLYFLLLFCFPHYLLVPIFFFPSVLQYSMLSFISASVFYKYLFLFFFFILPDVPFSPSFFPHHLPSVLSFLHHCPQSPILFRAAFLPSFRSFLFSLECLP